MESLKSYALITGASSGVGRETAILLSKKYNLVLHGRSEEKLLKTKSLCSPSSNILLWQRDFSSVEMIEASLQELMLSNQIQIEAFVHSAGMTLTLPLRMLDLPKMQQVLNTNFLAAALIARVLVQKKYNGGALKNMVFVSSNISRRGAKGFAAYGASKGALDAFMRCLAVELAPKVRVNSVLPGAMKTEMTEQMFEDKSLLEKMEKSYPLGLGAPQKIAAVVEFLLSDAAGWITGQQITVDGGRTIDVTA